MFDFGSYWNTHSWNEARLVASVFGTQIYQFKPFITVAIPLWQTRFGFRETIIRDIEKYFMLITRQDYPFVINI